MARIMFSGGSQQMAHNNDDLYERWILRRSEMPIREREAKPEAHIEIFVPELPESFSFDEAQQLRRDLADKKALVMSKLTELKLELTPAEYRKAKAPLSAASALIDRQIGIVNQHVRDIKNTRRSPIVKNTPSGDENLTSALTARVNDLKQSSSDPDVDIELTQAKQELLETRRVNTEAKLAELESKLAVYDLESKVIERQRGYIEILKGDIQGLRTQLIRVQQRVIELQDQLLQQAEEAS